MSSILRSVCAGKLAIARIGRNATLRGLNTDTAPLTSSAPPRRPPSWLYVPCSSDRKLEKSLTSTSDVLIYDLEDSVPPGRADKDTARSRLAGFLSNSARGSSSSSMHPSRVATRVNAVETEHFAADIAAVMKIPTISTIVLPKVHSAADLDVVAEAVNAHATDAKELSLVASIESARALWRVGDIAGWCSSHRRDGVQLRVRALLFAAEDFCADTAIIRTRSRQELLYARSRIVVAAKAFGLEAIDMVCVNYKDPVYLEEECSDGRRLGFTGKQAIHPNQVDTIQRTYGPTTAEILRAAHIVRAMERAHASEIGAVGLDDGQGGTEMIDAPMLKQAQNTIEAARAANMEIPHVE